MFNRSFPDSMLSDTVPSGHARMITMSITSPNKNLSTYSYNRSKTRDSLLMIFSMAHISNISLRQRLMLETIKIEIIDTALMSILLLLSISICFLTVIITFQIIQRLSTDSRIMTLLSKTSSLERIIKTESAELW